MERWSNERPAFCGMLFKSNSSATLITQREFMRHFNIGRNGKVPTGQTNLDWIQDFRTTASAQSENSLELGEV